MIRIDIVIDNPFKKHPFKNIWTKCVRVSENKTLELQFYRYSYHIFEFGVETIFKGQDHAGPKFELGLFGWYFVVSLPDNRHWDYINNCWETATPD